MTDTPSGQKKTTAKKAAAVKKVAAPAKAARPQVSRAAPVEPERHIPQDERSTGLEPIDPGPDSDRRLYRLVAAGAGVVALLLTGALIYSVLRIGDDNHANSLRSSALRAAATYGAWVSSYDYTDLSAPTSTWTRIESHSTPTFKASFEKTKANLTSLVKDYNASATGKVVSAGISSLSNSRAVVLLFIDQTVKNKLQKSGPTTEPLRAQLILVRSHGRWLIDDLQVPS
jgi:Mce-associated membrane protein